jgi:hypothetical protein
MELANSTPAGTAAGRLIRVAPCGLHRMLTDILWSRKQQFGGGVSQWLRVKVPMLCEA